MNNQRRKQIDAIAERIREIASDLANILSDETDALESMPESLQEGDRGQAMQEAIDNLEYSEGSAGELIEYLEAAVA